MYEREMPGKMLEAAAELHLVPAPCTLCMHVCTVNGLHEVAQASLLTFMKLKTL